ncbi:MAG: hypothetical protein JMN27_18230 [gamma proteobacterium endosymbiont of Lamellibrachia anaximandri]|nr:hypothetical protein [gamma proteobacterium endosymbiont of Lamellibrachia anaximandri]MBL3535743.1 hypothetical protein [gamma proteobacterium endosymbiont of Lamellibrachia anaximandri]
MDNDFEEVKAELAALKEDDEKKWNGDIIKRTISKLLSIEKRSLYGAVKRKNKMMDEILLSELKKYRELKNDLKEG